jgi:tetratricopeptide (TPR) repeat protein
MPGNKAIFDRAMEQSREAARRSSWDEALKGAVRAIQEFPKDTDARTAAAVALFHTGKLAQALQVLEELRQADPNNPFFLEYIARTQEGQGNIDAAVQTYLNLVALQEKRRSTARMISALREALRLRPDMVDQRKRLADLLVEANARQEGAAEYLTIARHYRDRGALEEAAANAEASRRLEPNNREVKELLSALHEAMARGAADASTPEESDPDDQRGARQSGSLRSQNLSLDKIVALAVELQQEGDIEGAITEYERALEGGLNRADVLYSLGLLYQERGDHQAAVKVLTQAKGDPEYELSSHFALGESYRELNDLPKAAQEYEQAIRLVDLDTIGKSEAEDLIQMYESVVAIYQQMGDLAQAASRYSTLASFFQSKRWGRDRAAEFNQRAKEMTERNMLAKLRSLGTGMLGPPPEASGPKPPPPPESDDVPETWGKIRPITEFLRDSQGSDTTGDLTFPEELAQVDPLEQLDSLPAMDEPDFAPVTPLDTEGLDDRQRRWVVASEKYIEQGLLEAALDACHEIIRLNVDYIPIHLRMGEVLERQHRPQDALAKYQILIDTFMVRDESQRAIDVYYRLIELSPDVINARARLADLLEEVGRKDEAAQQLARVADNYLRMGQTNRAIDEYRKVLQWAPKNKEMHAQYGLALFKLERFESALGEFRKALELEADDPVSIARINMTLAVMGDQPAMVWDSLATVLDMIKGQSQKSNLVQAEYRAALMVTDAPVIHYILGIIQQTFNQHSSALLELEQALALLEFEASTLLPSILVHQAMADSFIVLGEAENALEQLRKCQALAGQSPPNQSIKHAFARPLSQGDLVRRMAEAYAASDDLPGAEQALREAQRLLPYDRAIYMKLADIFFRQGKLDEAITQLDDLANYYEEHQYLDQAIETLQDALKLAPNNIPIGGRLARLYIRRGYPDKGVEGLLRVSDQQKRAGQLKDAVASLQQAAEILWMQGKQDEVLSVYDKIVQIAPDDIEARQWLAIMHTLAFRSADAIREKKEIVRIFAERRDYDNAIAELHQIIGLNQQDTDAYYMLGDMLMRRGEYGQTVQLYNRMLKMDGVEQDRVEALLAAANRMMEQQKVSS